MLGSLAKGTAQTSPLRLLLSPSVLLTSVKSWLCIIFSTISSASILVSSTRVGWLSIESFFLLVRGKTYSAFQDRDFYIQSCFSWPQSSPQWLQTDPLLPEDKGAGSVSPSQRKVFAPQLLTGRVCPAAGVVWEGEVASPVCGPAPPQDTPRSCWAPRTRCCWWTCSGGGSSRTCWRSGSAPCCNLPTQRDYKPHLLPFLAAQITGRTASQQHFCSCTQRFRHLWAHLQRLNRRLLLQSRVREMAANHSHRSSLQERKGMWPVLAELCGSMVTRDLGLLAGVARVPWVPWVENFLWAGQVLIWLFWDTCQGTRGHCLHHNQASAWCTDQLGVEADLGMTDQGKGKSDGGALLYRPAQGFRNTQGVGKTTVSFSIKFITISIQHVNLQTSLGLVASRRTSSVWNYPWLQASS